MSTTPLAESNLQANLVSSRLLPDEGPKAIPIILDFTGAITSYTLDLTNIIARQYISMLQTFFIDTSDPACAALSIDTSVIGVQTITVKGQTQGYYNVQVPNPPKLTFRTAAPGGIARVILLNVGIPGHSWGTV